MNSALDEFFANKNWEQEDGEWYYIGEIDPKKASSELVEMKEDKKFLATEVAKYIAVAARLRADLDEAINMFQEYVEHGRFGANHVPSAFFARMKEAK